MDNYDSFTYILHHYLLLTGIETVVYKNDEITISDIERMSPQRIIISPGPETPLQAGISMTVIARFHKEIPILGVCLGHQALGMFFGGQLVHTPPMHGKTSTIHHNGHPLFANMPAQFRAMRYHSLAITDLENTALEPLAWTEDGVLMALAHNQYPCTGVQFHPESIGTEYGQQLLNNWVGLTCGFPHL